MTHSFISPLPPKARVSFPLSRPHYCYAASRELELLGYAIDQATRFWESNWHTKGTGQLGSLRILLQAHDKRAKLLKLLDGPPDAAEEDTQEAEPIENIGKSKAQSTNPSPAVNQPPPIDPSTLRSIQPQACDWNAPQLDEAESQMPPEAYYDYLPEDESVIQGYEERQVLADAALDAARKLASAQMGKEPRPTRRVGFSGAGLAAPQHQPPNRWGEHVPLAFPFSPQVTLARHLRWHNPAGNGKPPPR